MPQAARISAMTAVAIGTWVALCALVALLTVLVRGAGRLQRDLTRLMELASRRPQDRDLDHDGLAPSGLAAVVGALAAQAEATRSLAESSRSESAAIRALADMSAESIRLATGSFVFELRDRFDAGLATVRVAFGGTEWASAPPGDVGPSPMDVPVEALVFEDGDRAWCTVRLSVGQSTERRVVRARWSAVPAEPVWVVAPVGYSAPAGHRVEDVSGGYLLPADTFLFVELSAGVDAAACAAGRFVVRSAVELAITDTRDEGAVATVDVEIVCMGTVVADTAGGVRLTGLDADAVVSRERRDYFLDKAHAIELALPRTTAAPVG